MLVSVEYEGTVVQGGLKDHVFICYIYEGLMENPMYTPEIRFN